MMRYLTQVKTYLDRLKQNPIVQNTIWLLISKGISLVMQAAYFVTIARTLGVAKYGEFVSLTALVAIVSPFVGLGIEVLLVKNVAKDRALFSVYWGNSLLITLLTGVGFTIGLGLIAPLILNHSISQIAILFVAASDLIFASVTTIAGRAFQSVDRLNISARISVIAMLIKVVPILLFV